MKKRYLVMHGVKFEMVIVMIWGGGGNRMITVNIAELFFEAR